MDAIVGFGPNGKLVAVFDSEVSASQYCSDHLGAYYQKVPMVERNYFANWVIAYDVKRKRFYIDIESTESLSETGCNVATEQGYIHYSEVGDVLMDEINSAFNTIETFLDSISQGESNV